MLAGGRVFAGVHHHAYFAVEETSDHFSIAIDSDDHRTHLRVDAKAAEALPAGSVFGNVERASEFFRGGSLGYSPSFEPGHLDALELHSLDWKVESMAVERIESSFFDDRQRFPAGSIQFDCALLMRGMRHEWHEREPMCVECAAV